ncbi:MAG: Sip1-related alpha-galactosidase [Fimbriimonadaceae bacterium]
MPNLTDGFHTLSRDALDRGAWSLETGHTRFLALDRTGMYWCRAKVGGTDASHVEEAAYALLELGDRRFRVLMPLVDGDRVAYLRGTSDGFELVWFGALPEDVASEATLLYSETGPDPFVLAASAIRAVRQRLGSFRLRSEKRHPAFVDDLFWCTWEAFFHEVDESKTLDGLRSLRSAGVSVRGVILDDGWLDADGDYLNELDARRDKFPSGLEGLIDKARSEADLRWFGVWHAMLGHWGGLNPDGPAARRFRTVDHVANIRPWQEKSIDVHPIHPDDISRFYQQGHRHLKDAGVGMVKIDGQASLEAVTAGKLGRGTTMAAYQTALQSSVAHWLDNNLIACMPHAVDLVYNLWSGAVMRTSDDYFHNRPSSHGRHVWWNAAMALWVGDVVIPDWDMFWTQHPTGWFHAAARAISGGPVYVGDRPGCHDVEILRRLALPDGRVLRPDRAALPSRESLFVDAPNDARIFKVTNRCGPVGVVGAFNCRENGDAVSGVVSPSDVHDLDLGEVAVWRVSDRTLLLPESDRLPVQLAPYEWEIAVFAPFLAGWLAPIGLPDLLCPPAVFGPVADADGMIRIEVKAAGDVLFAVRGATATARLNGRPCALTREKDRVRVTVPQAGTLELRRT